LTPSPIPVALKSAAGIHFFSGETKMPGRLKNDNPTGRGGRREGSGRKPSEFKAKCKELSGHPEFFKWADRVFRGEDTEVKIVDGAKWMVPASANEKIYLWEKISAYGEGRPINIVDVNGNIGLSFSHLISLASQERDLDSK
jgi:hypothetical protein